MKTTKATKWMDQIIKAHELMNKPFNENVYSVDAICMNDKRMFVRGIPELAEAAGIEYQRKPHSSRDQLMFKYRGYTFFELVDALETTVGNVN